MSTRVIARETRDRALPDRGRNESEKLLLLRFSNFARTSERGRERKRKNRQSLSKNHSSLFSSFKEMAATARLSLPHFDAPISIRRATKHSRIRSRAARAADEGFEQLPFPMPTSSSLSSSSLAAAAAAAPPSPLPPPPSWPRAIALDVEFSHYQQLDRTKNLVLRVPADVAVVSDEGRVLLRALVAPPHPLPPPPEVVLSREETPPPRPSLRWVGGVPAEETEHQGQELDAVVRELARLLSGGALLVGHGVTGDLRVLGGEVVSSSSSSPSSSPPSPSSSPSLRIQASRVRDTSTSPGLLKKNSKRGKGSSSAKLEELFAVAFGLELRRRSEAEAETGSSPSPSPAPPRHDPVADAAAAMALYLSFVRGTMGDASSKEELEEMETARVLQEFRERERRERKRENENEKTKNE